MTDATTRKRTKWLWIGGIALFVLLALAALLAPQPSEQIEVDLRELAVSHSMHEIETNELFKVRPRSDAIRGVPIQSQYVRSVYAMTPTIGNEYGELWRDVEALFRHKSSSSTYSGFQYQAGTGDLVSINSTFSVDTESGPINVEVALDHSPDKPILLLVVTKEPVTLGQKINGWFRRVTGGP